MTILAVETGKCGWGFHGGLIPELRLVWLRFTKSSSDIADALQSARNTLDVAKNAVSVSDRIRRSTDEIWLMEREVNIQLRKELDACRKLLPGHLRGQSV